MLQKIEEKKLLRLTYILACLCFVNLSILKWPIDYKAIVYGVVIIFIVTWGNFLLKRFFPNGDKFIYTYASILSIIGITMVYRINSSLAFRQIIIFIIGQFTFLGIVIILPGIRRYCRLKYFYLAGTFIFMSMSLFFGVEKNGAQNWVEFGNINLSSFSVLNPIFAKLGLNGEIILPGFSFQPSELGKIFLVAYLASSLRKYKERKDLYLPAMAVALSLGFMVIQKDLGSALIIFAISITMLYIATSNIKYILACIILSCIGSVSGYYLFSHVRVRVSIWLNPWVDPYGTGYQVVQSLISIASGGLFGTGLGLGYPNTVPYSYSDFIFSVICEEMGMLTGIAVIIIYFLLFYRSIRASIGAGDNFTKLLSVGYSSMIAAQTLVIIGGVMKFIPLTGITLPLVSYGGSSMVTTYIALGLLQKISEEEYSLEQSFE
ncbi:FtsW/RodA/SpoVE family cell cycle protein [Clostridium sp. DL1XJH146]